MSKITLRLTVLEARMLLFAAEIGTVGIDEPPEFPGDWPRGERAATKRAMATLRAALPPKEEEDNEADS